MNNLNYLLFFGLLFCIPHNTLLSQSCTNLVPNGSFENFSALPTDDCDWELAIGWTNAATTNFCSPDNGSPDYYHTQGEGVFSALPENFFANLSPQDGNAIMGVGGYFNIQTNAREYLSTALSCPMIPGEIYEVSFYLNNGDLAGTNNYSNGWGITLTETPLLQPDGCNCLIEAMPQFSVPDIVSGNEWQNFTFTFTADQAYEYLTFGNFLSDAALSLEEVSPNDFSIAYIFIDNISITPISSSPLELGEDINLCGSTVDVVLDAGTVACASYLWSTGETTSSIQVTTPGIYSVSLTNDCGVQTDEIEITADGNLVEELNEVICQGEAYTLNGTSYTEAGSYIQTFTNDQGCTVEATLNLAVAATSFQDLVVQICEGENYELDGVFYTETGVYTQNLTSVQGCDSTIQLMLEVFPSYAVEIDTQICAGEVFPLNGVVYEETGVYVQNTFTEEGCDSTVVLDLLVQNNVEEIETKVCEGETITLNGSVYDQSGVYIQNFESTIGCDSTLVLNLEVVERTTETIEAQILQGDLFNLNGANYGVQGEYTQVLTSELGCDSILTLLLEVERTDIYFPNVFSPNGDGINDVFKPFSGIKTASVVVQAFMIFDRWGAQVYEEQEQISIDNLIGWNGFVRDEEAGTGVYAYYLSLDIEGRQREFSGDLILIR